MSQDRFDCFSFNILLIYITNLGTGQNRTKGQFCKRVKRKTGKKYTKQKLKDKFIKKQKKNY